MTDPIFEYSRNSPAEFKAICQSLRAEIDAALPKSSPKIWHGMPVWFIDDSPIVGYKVTAKHVNLLFWNGQAFNDPLLKAAGKCKAAQIQFNEKSQIDPNRLRQWLKKARTEIWDHKNLRQPKSTKNEVRH
jgi:hypothetical protein